MAPWMNGNASPRESTGLRHEAILREAPVPGTPTSCRSDRAAFSRSAEMALSAVDVGSTAMRSPARTEATRARPRRLPGKLMDEHTGGVTYAEPLSPAIDVHVGAADAAGAHTDQHCSRRAGGGFFPGSQTPISKVNCRFMCRASFPYNKPHDYYHAVVYNEKRRNRRCLLFFVIF
jgi:hypothetical protein